MLKKILFLCFISASLAGSEWQNLWVQAIDKCINKEFHDAEHFFSKAILDLEKNRVETHPHIYVDRARLYSLLDKNDLALIDLNKALSNPLLAKTEKIRATTTKIITLYRLGLFEDADLEVENLKLLYPFPKLELYNDWVVVRNIPDCDCSIHIIKKVIAKLYCNEEDDVTISNGICIAKRSKSKLGCIQKQDFNICASSDFSSRKQAIEDCQYWCDKIHVAAEIFCAGTFKKIKCQAACIAVIEFLKDGCYKCCKRGEFYEDCIEPFGDIVGKMGNVCDPMWD